jgi:transglutaminase-like putative cysteine protease
MNFYPTPRPMTLGRVPSGREGTKQTLHAMTRLARAFKKDAGIRELAASLVRDLPQYDTAGEIRALHAFVRDHIRYTNDIRKVETLHTPRAILEMGVGDCDDKSVLLASLLESIGRPTRFVAVGFGPAGGHSHVLVEVRVGKRGRWVPLETIKPVEAGWEPANVTRRMLSHN